ncbi:hypothetical protein SAMN04487765_3207 [Tenacibaculum sp. MAR_2010_89]|uniref:hypothetical protein n=1 Tax=Tenacibaculum sp. MAR_2010_89 TaxID=1250198 RepID=UPI0008953FC9|nr:hypothetical protein [Tenacibaculum sp. MAR_2010_89]SEE57698.1 hypothetical protein SAMN04487765_3207 [Tenacibaculum sp. MAR_2010_89]
MKASHYIFLVLLLIQSITSIGQEKVISVLERDRDGGYEKNKDDYKNNIVVDINSVLQIDLNKNVILEKARQNTNGVSTSIVEKIKFFTKILESRKSLLKSFNATLSAYNYNEFKEDTSNEKNKEWAREMSKIARDVIDLADILKEENVNFQRYRLEYMYDAAQKELDKLIKELEEYADKEGVYVQFGAWLSNNGQTESLHLPGFDSIAPKKPYEVQRWQILPTEEQLKEFEEFSKLTQENKTSGLTALKNIVYNQLTYLKKIFSNELEMLVNQINEDLRALPVATEVNQIIVDFTSFKSDLEVFEKEIKERVTYYENLTFNNQSIVFQVISQIKNDIDLIDKEGKKLLIKSTSLYTKIKALGSHENLESTVNKLKDNLDSWIRIAFNNEIVGAINELLSGTPIDFSLLKFSNKVFKLSLKDIPKQTDLDLITTGKRKSGDRIAFKLEVNSKKKLLYSENREVYMYKVLPHLEGSVGVIFADPLANTEVKTQFQMAPYYNLIFKGIWDQKARRKSVTYNRIFDWGVGLHMSAPDFDADDVPELGVGVVVSLLHDYVQSGIAINVFTGDPYWFFGLKLPVPSFNIGTVRSTNN